MQKNQISEQAIGKIKLVLLVAIVTLAVGIFMYYFTFTSYGYNNWTFVIMNIILFSVFFLLASFRKKLNRLPNSVYVAFIVALFAEMYGIPLTMYFIAGVFGYNKIFSLEFLLTQVMGQQPFYIVYHYWVFPASKIIIGAGMLIVIFGWYQIFKAKGELVTSGLYKYTRNPQYIGFLMITGGLNVQWLTIITTAIWPVLAVLYWRLAKIEEREAEAKYGEAFRQYKNSTPRFIPHIRKHQTKDVQNLSITPQNKPKPL